MRDDTMWLLLELASMTWSCNAILRANRPGGMDLAIDCGSTPTIPPQRKIHFSCSICYLAT